MRWVGGFVDSWIHVESLGLVGSTASNQFEVRIGFGRFDDIVELVECSLVDDCVDKVSIVFRSTNLDLSDLFFEILLELGPDLFNISRHIISGSNVDGSYRFSNIHSRAC